MVIIWSLVGVGLLGVPQANAAKILFIVSAVDADGTAALANDEEVVTRLQGKGHTVTIADDQDLTLDSFLVGQDLILISSSVGSGNQPLNMLASDPLKTGIQPVICYEPGLFDELGFQIVTTNPGYGNAAGHSSLAMNVVNQSHPLAAGKVGTVSMVNPGTTATFSSSDLPVIVGNDAIMIASTAANAPGVDLGAWPFGRTISMTAWLITPQPYPAGVWPFSSMPARLSTCITPTRTIFFLRQ